MIDARPKIAAGKPTSLAGHLAPAADSCLVISHGMRHAGIGERMEVGRHSAVDEQLRGRAKFFQHDTHRPGRLPHERELRCVAQRYAADQDSRCETAHYYPVDRSFG